MKVYLPLYCHIKLFVFHFHSSPIDPMSVQDFEKHPTVTVEADAAPTPEADSQKNYDDRKQLAGVSE